MIIVEGILIEITAMYRPFEKKLFARNTETISERQRKIY